MYILHIALIMGSVYGAVIFISSKVTSRVHLVNADTASLGHQPSDQTNRLGLGVRRKQMPSTSTIAVFTARRLAKRGICRRRVSVCVCVCVCLSVTLRYCIKTAKRRITQTTPYDSPMTLVFWCQISWRNSNAITPYGGDKCRWGGLKFITFDKKRAITRKRFKIDA